MATPHVSGVAALVINKLKVNGVETINTEVVRVYLAASAFDLGDAGRDNTFSNGLVDARAAIDVADGGNMKPIASYTYDLNDLTVSFSNSSYDRDGSIVSLEWDLGDGTITTQSDPVHTYAAYGTYTVTLTVTDDAGDSSIATKEIQVRQIPGGALENGVPFENIDAAQGEEYHWWLDVDVSAGKQLDALTFAISGGSDDADIYVRHGARPTTSTYDYRPYRGGNDETVEVGSDKLQDALIRAYRDYSGVDLVASYQLSDVGNNVDPVAGFSVDTSALTATFTDTSTDSDGEIVGWLWDFGDGNTSTEQNPVYTYSSAGTYSVSLTVTDDGGATNTISNSVTVANDNNAPVADFSYDVNLLTVSLTDANSDSDGQIVDWLWDLGDGNTSTEQNPVHTYAASGTYNISLVVTDDDGASNSVSSSVSASDCVSDCGETYANNDPLVIDDNDWLSLRSSITVDRVGDSGLVTVKIRILHDDAAQLLVKLRAPDGTKWYVSK